MFESIRRRIQALEASIRATVATWPTLGQWRRFHAGDVSSIPPAQLHEMQQRRETAMKQVEETFSDFEDED